MPGEERKLATVLFADLVGSTSLGERLDPERARALLDRFYEAMAAEIELAGGTVEKFAGDAVMAAFGAPAALEDHAERALHAALAMRGRLAELFDEAVRLRIGVNTGEVVVDLPSEQRSLVTGDAVNVAARLEQAAEPGEILVGERTVAAAGGAFEFGAPASAQLKGKTDPVPYRPLIRSLSLMRPRGVSGLARAFVGRGRELDMLKAAYSRALERGAAELVTIVGDAGVGKTRLVREFWEHLDAHAPTTMRRTGRCLPYGHGTTYWAVGEVLKEELGIRESDTPEKTLARLGSRPIIGLALGLDTAGDLHPLSARDRLHAAWIEFLGELVGQAPVVLLIEDLHLAEQPLLDLLERTLDDVRGPLLLVATGRPELFDVRPGWGARRTNAETIPLEPLSHDEAGALIEELLAADLPERLRELVVARGEGNPFFVEEIIGRLIDEGVVVRDEDGWRAGEEPASFDVPDSVQAVLAARIDLLPPAEKAALQAAAVIGRVFWSGPVYELVGELHPDLRVLEERDFIRRRLGSSLAGEEEYAIKHALTREVAYASLAKARRARLHADFALWLERLGGGRDDHASLLAHHYAAAVRPEDADLAWDGAEDERRRLCERAVSWLRRSARLAVGRYEIDEGLAMLGRARELGAPDDVALWREIAHAHVLKFDGEAFWTAMEKALAATSDDATRGELYAELAYQTATRSGMWMHMPEPELVEGWIDKALELADPNSETRAKALIARARWQPDEHGTAAIEASAIAERLGNLELRSSAWDVRGIAAFVMGEYELGRAWEERRFELLDEITDPDHVADIYAAPISGTIWKGRFREARRLASEHDRIASRLTPHHGIHAVAILIEVEELAARWETIRALQERAEKAVIDGHETPCVRSPRTLLVCAAANELLGDRGAANVLEQHALDIWMEGYGETLDTPRLRLALARNDAEEAERLLAQPIVAHGWHRGWFVFANQATRLDALGQLGKRELVEREAPGHLRANTYLEPFALRALGRVRADSTLLEQAEDRFTAMKLDWHAEKTRELLN